MPWLLGSDALHVSAGYAARVCEFSGSIPRELGSLEKLADVGFSSNQLSGPIPEELGSRAQLIQMYTYENELWGSIPREFGSLEKLTDSVSALTSLRVRSMKNLAA